MSMSVIERAEQRLQDEIRQNDLGADNGHLLAYWSAYLDGARAQRNELTTFPSGREDEDAGLYSNLVRALRCENTGDDECGSSDCPYWSGLGCMDGQLMEDAADAIEALQAQLPKRGEWITIRLNNGGSYTGCSCCEAPIPTDTMLDYIPESESKYCYSCGAKMTEAQDA